MACGESRRALFEANERASLQPLPADPWEWGEWTPRKVAPNGHVCVERNYYSVPDGNIGRSVGARGGERMVEVFLERGGERIAVHPRQRGRNQYATRPEHMPDRLRAVRDIREPDYGNILLERARGIEPNARAWGERCFASRDFPDQAFATVQGMIRLAEDHGRPRPDALCAEALDLNRLPSGFLRESLAAQRRLSPLGSPPTYCFKILFSDCCAPPCRVRPAPRNQIASGFIPTPAHSRALLTAG